MENDFALRMISIVINADTRPGCGAEVNTTGDHGSGSLNGVRSWDFLTDGVTNKLNFFRGHEVELILYIDEHEKIPLSVDSEIRAILRNNEPHRLVVKSHERSSQRWNELLYLEALKLATGDYIAHFDADCAAFRRQSDRNDVVDYPMMVNPDVKGTHKFVCQPTTLNKRDHGMWWASTRFFFCRRETLPLDEIEHCIRDESYRFAMYGHCPALEHVLAQIAGRDSVFYPPANWDDYMVFSWSRYHRGLLRELNAWDYDDVREYILSCGIHGPNDVISKPI